MTDFLFVDETGGTNYAGICLARVNAHNYAAVSRRFIGALSESGWRISEEFKGQCVFSSSKGCDDISVDERVRLTERLFDSTSGDKNVKVNFFYASRRQTMTSELYFELLEICLLKALKSKGASGDKNLVSLYFDQRADVTARNVAELLTNVASRKNRLVVEGHVTEVKSNNLSVGVQLADLVGYVCGKQDQLSADFEMMEGGKRKTGKERQLASSKRLLEILKKGQVERVMKC